MSKVWGLLKSKRFWYWYAVLWIFTVPVSIAVICAAFGVTIGVLVTIFAVLLSLCITAVALCLGGVAMPFCLPFMKGANVGVGLGLSLAGVGIGIYLCMMLVFLWRFVFQNKPLSPKWRKAVLILAIVAGALAAVGGVIFVISFAVAGWNVEAMNFSF